jgi:hypothetical protein
MLPPGTDRTGTRVAMSVIAERNLRRHPSCRLQKSRLRVPTGAIPKTSRLTARSRAFAAAADGQFGDDGSAPCAMVRASCQGQFWPTDRLCLMCDPVHRREDERQLKIAPIHFDGRHADETNRTNLERGQSCDSSRSLCRIAAFPRVCSAAGGCVPGRG